MIANERRRYFRVTDLIGMRYRFLSESERDLAIAAQPTDLKSVLSRIEDQISVVLQTIKSSQPEIHQLMELYNQKINLAFGHGLADQNKDLGHSVRACQVNLSACGIAFPCPEIPELNQHIDLDITLYPSNLRIQMVAAVIGIEELDASENENRCLIRANYINVSDADQELLVQHVIKRQAQQLKERRAES